SRAGAAHVVCAANNQAAWGKHAGRRPSPHDCGSESRHFESEVARGHTATRIHAAARLGRPGPQLIPWDRVNVLRNTGVALPCDDAGTRLRIDGRDVVIPLKTARAAAIAPRTQHRPTLYH